MGDWLVRLDEDGSSQAAYRTKRVAVVAVAATYVLFWMWLAFVAGFVVIWVPLNLSASSSWVEPSGTTPALVVAAVCAVIGGAVAAFKARGVWVNGTASALSTVGATPAEPAYDRVLLDVVEELSLAAGQPAPAVYVIENDGLNAFSTSDRGEPCIAVTTGLCNDLTRAELSAVVAHELAHMRHHDGILEVFLGELLGPMSETKDTLTSDPRAVVAFVPALLCAATASAMGRFAATGQTSLTDLNSIELTRDPEALAGALRKIGHKRADLGRGEKTVAKLMTVPLAETGDDLRARIDRLHELAV
jgi:heat shock protein HtpX